MTDPTRPPADPTPDVLPTGLPDGWDDPSSPWYIPEDVAAHYKPPRISDYMEAGNTTIFPPSQHRPKEVAYGASGWTEWTEEAEAAARTYASPAFKAHHAAKMRAAAELERGRRAAAEAARWDRAHRCEVCSGLAGDVARYRVLDVYALNAPSLELAVQACPACARTLALLALERGSQDTLDGRRTRRGLASDYLDRVASQ